MKSFAVCKQDVSENLVIPQPSSLPKQSQNLALSKNILTDAKTLMFLCFQKDVLVLWGHNVILVEQRVMP